MVAQVNHIVELDLVVDQVHHEVAQPRRIRTVDCLLLDVVAQRRFRRCRLAGSPRGRLGLGRQLSAILVVNRVLSRRGRFLRQGRRPRQSHKHVLRRMRIFRPEIVHAVGTDPVAAKKEGGAALKAVHSGTFNQLRELLKPQHVHRLAVHVAGDALRHHEPHARVLIARQRHQQHKTGDCLHTIKYNPPP